MHKTNMITRIIVNDTGLNFNIGKQSNHIFQLLMVMKLLLFLTVVGGNVVVDVIN